MRIFKYVAPERVDILLNRHVRFTQAADFNDPFEVLPYLAAVLPPDNAGTYISAVVPDLRAMFEDAIRGELASSRLEPEFHEWATQLILNRVSGGDLAAFIADALPQIVKLAEPSFGLGVQSRLGERLGVFSVAESPTNLLMWAHYGASHRGLLVELDGAHPFFNQSRPPTILGRLAKVTYSVDRPAITAYDPSVPTEVFADRLAREVLLTKGRDWEYEQEWRMVLPLDGTDHRIEGRVHLFPIPSQAITGVVLGARSSEETRTTVFRCVKQNGDLSHVTIRQATISPSKYEVLLERAGE